ncbi:MAG: sensor histidine kinase [Planctomycetota bacterium]
MFLVRSIRRRVVTLFSMAILSTLIATGAGFVSLLWHQAAVRDLDFVLNQSPNPDQLSRVVSRIPESLSGPLDIRHAAAAAEMQTLYQQCVSAAEKELEELRRRSEKLPLSDEEALTERRKALGRLDRIYQELQLLRTLGMQIRPADSARSRVEFLELQYRASLIVTRVQKSLDHLLGWRTRRWLLDTWQREKQHTASLMQYTFWTAVAGMIWASAALLAAMRWISRPIREIASGCTRIADGDTAWRLPVASRWQDELADLVAGVNCMADRFQQSEEDLQEKVRERSEQLMRSQRLANVGFLAAGVAHEINNPLTAISVAADSLEMRLSEQVDLETPDGQELLERVAMIRRESRRCGDITARLLDFSRGERGQHITTDIAELVHEVLSMVRHLGRFSDRSIEFECSSSVTADVIPSQIKQVILNLVANALHATEAGGQVSIRLVEQVDNVVLSVSDNGCGMDPETLQHVFDPFFTSREQGQGTGLGLSITHRIVEDHGGTVTPVSAGAGLGSTFQVRLPRRARTIRAA